MNKTYENIIDEIINLEYESELCEVKEAKANFDFKKLGKYFSALSNEANLNNREEAYLLFGLKDNPIPRKVIGTNYRSKNNELEELKKNISDETSGNITFKEIYVSKREGKRIILFVIPKALNNVPTSFKGHYYGREGESLVPLSLEKIERIRNSKIIDDWSSIICENATLKDLDKEAINKAKNEYKIKNPDKIKEIDSWDDLTFLNKSKLTKNGKITNATLVLVGKESSEYLIEPSIARITWILKDDENKEVDYEHFAPPLILKTEEMFNKIRNLNYRYIINDSLFPLEIKMYDPYVIREALHNCIAHQDYTLNSRITVVEEKDKLIFKNAGSFLPKTIENVIESDAPQDFYRNNFLTRAMVNLNMIDTIGSGIKKMFETQQKRFFPLPEYNFSNNSVKVTIYGKILDENYTKLLMKKIDLNLKTIILLDKVQKNENLDNSDYKYLRKLKMIEGRRPNVHISKKIAEATGDKVNYIKRKALDNDYYEKIIISFLKEFNKASRKELEAILFDKFSDSLNESQKIYKVKNLLTKMKKENKIKIIGAGKYSEWILND